MPQLGGYRTIKELSRTGFAVVYTACRAGEDAEAYAAKVYQPAAGLGKNEHTERQVRSFAEGVSIQRKVAAEDASHWARVHTDGATEDVAFYVTDLCRSSLLQVIDGRLDVTGADLRNIITSIVHGLIALQKACRRPHGNLKPGNVLIADAASLSQARVLLCDPLPSEYVDPETHGTADLREVAEFIHQLVLHQPTPATKGWQVPDSPKWNRLGKQAGYWRDLCNRLLNLEMRPNAITLEGLAEELDRLPAPRKPVARRALAAGVAVAVLAIALTVLLCPDRDRRLSREEVQEVWSRAIIWVAALHDALDNMDQKEDPNVRRIYRQAVVPVYRPIEDNPGKVDDLGGRNRLILLIQRRDAPANQMKDVNDIVIAADRDMCDAIAELRTFFFSDVNDPEYKGWLWLKELRTVSDFNDLGCRKEIAKLCGRIPVSEEDAVQRLTNGCAAGRALSEAVKKFSTATTDLSDAVKEALRMQRQWRQVQEDRRRLDAKRKEAWSLVDEVRQSMPSRDQDPRTRNARRDLKALETEADRIDTRIGTLRQSSTMDDYAKALRENLESILEEIDAIKARASDLREKPGQWYREIMRYEIADPSPSIKQEWHRRRANAFRRAGSSGRTVEYGLDEFSRWEKNRDPEGMSIFREIKSKVETTRHDINDVREHLLAQPQWPAGTGEESWVQLHEESLTGVYNRKREKTLTTIFTALKDRAVFPLSDVVPEPNESLLAFSAWRDEFGRLIQDYSQIDRILGNFGDFNELSRVMPEKSTSIGDLDQSWRENTTVWDADVETALSDVAVAARLLWQIRSENDPCRVIEHQKEAPKRYEIAVLCAAWWRLRSLPDWPSNPGQWRIERELEQMLADLLQSRPGTLNSQLADESLRRQRTVIRECSNQCVRLSATAEPADHQKLVAFFTGNDWQRDKYNMKAFYDPNEQGRTFERGKELTADTAAQWLKEVEDYRRLDVDLRKSEAWEEAVKSLTNGISKLESTPRESQDWAGAIDRLHRCIADGLKNPQELSARQGLADANQTLTGYEKDLKRITATKTRPVKKYETDIDRGLEILTEELPALRVRIASHIKPLEYRFLDFKAGSGGGKRIIVFNSEAGLSGFAPVMPRGAGFAEIETSAGWHEVAQQGGFTSVTMGNERVSWPDYMCAERDETVVLRCISTDGTGIPTFYMSLHEITNEQYAKFLDKASQQPDGPRDDGGLQNWWAEVKLAGGKIRLVQDSRQFRGEEHDQIEVINGRFRCVQGYGSHPAVRITLHGATAYAGWLAPGANVPTDRQYLFAAQSTYHSKDNWHIRGQAWAERAKEWNQTLEDAQEAGMYTEQERTWPPVGADEMEYWDVASGDPATNAFKTLEPLSVTDRFVAGTEGAEGYLPRPVSLDSHRLLCDLVGNVWEWCRDSNNRGVLCGGSCLSKTKNTVPDARLPFAEGDSHRDVGFRIVVVPSEGQEDSGPL